MRGTRGVLLLVTALCAVACEPAVPPPPDPTPSPVSIPVTPVEPGVAFLRDAHRDMSLAAFQRGGLQQWERAVASLEAARRKLDGDARFSALLPEVDQLLEQARAVLADQPVLRGCAELMQGGRDAPGVDREHYDACWVRVQQSKAHRHALHDRMAELLRRAELAR